MIEQLIKAIRDGDITALRQMLADPACDPNMQDDKGFLPITWAVVNPAPPFLALKALLEAGADINAQNRNDGRTALHVALESGRDVDEKVTCLIDYGADTTITDDKGRDAFAVARDTERLLLFKLVEERAQFNGFRKLDDHTVIRNSGARRGPGKLGHIFNFYTRQVMTTANIDGAPAMAVQNFKDFEAKEVIKEAADALEDQGGDSRGWRGIVRKQKEGSKIKLGAK